MNFDIVTPSYNHSRYLRETIESVLSQRSPGVDVSYYVMDGGSTDGSIELIRSYESKLAFWRSGRDAGQTAAIAEGISMGRARFLRGSTLTIFILPGFSRGLPNF